MTYEQMRAAIPDKKSGQSSVCVRGYNFGRFVVCEQQNNSPAFLVDPDIFPSINHRAWCVDSGGYLCANVHNEVVRLHDFVMSYVVAEKPEGFYVDHINQDKLDNRKCNLRFVSPTESAKNLPLRSDNTSGYTGVSQAQNGRYRAYIRVGGKQLNLGYYDTAEAAWEARAEAETRHGYKTRVIREATDASSHED